MKLLSALLCIVVLVFSHILIVSAEEIEIGYDGGISNAAGYGLGGAKLGVRFTPPTYPCKVVAAKFYVTRTYEDCSVCNVLILDDDGSSGAPGSTIFGPTEAGPADSTGWMRYNIPTEDQFVVETGDFYINWIYEGCGTLGLSGGATHPERQWADIFGDWAIFHEDLSFMIRAIVEAENVPTWEYTWGHIKRLYE